MTLLLVSFIAGVLTVLAPCVLPLLPIIIGGSAQAHNRRNPYLITGALAVSIILFTLLLKFSTVFIAVPQLVWSTISGVIIIAFGVVSIFPTLWEKFSLALGLQANSDKLMESAAAKQGKWGDILLGLSFGPVFSSCSPTYFVILATVLPQSFALGTLYLIVYAAGLSLVLLLISLLGQKFVRRIRWAANPNGWFKKSLGILFIVVGIFILTGADKKLQTYLLDKGFYDITKLEYGLLDESKNGESDDLPTVFPQYQEIQSPSGFVNTEPITLGELVGKKIILIDFMTYSCINCVRTFPYLNDWYEKYQDDGLEIVGIHTPEFAFEKKPENVEIAMRDFGIKFPVVLDNDYATWNAYDNNYWPRKYLIDYEGNIVYDHIGEGNYEETEAKIRELLGLDGEPDTSIAEVSLNGARSPEIYFGASRNDSFANGQPNAIGVQTLTVPSKLVKNQLYLDGSWNIQPEYATPTNDVGKVIFRYVGGQVFLVASASSPATITILRDGVPLSLSLLGDDVLIVDGKSVANIDEDRLYSLIMADDGKEHTLELQLGSDDIEMYTFTFGTAVK
jgi:cytochrome c biogenesis protein CcdA/thiol-disulfide isomerase/thioredoxin